MFEGLKAKTAPIVLAISLAASGCGPKVPQTCDSTRAKLSGVIDRQKELKKSVGGSAMGRGMAAQMLNEERTNLEEWLKANNCQPAPVGPDHGSAE